MRDDLFVIGGFGGMRLSLFRPTKVFCYQQGLVVFLGVTNVFWHDGLFVIDSFGGKRCRYSTLRKMKEYVELFALPD